MGLYAWNFTETAAEELEAWKFWGAIHAFVSYISQCCFSAICNLIITEAAKGPLDVMTEVMGAFGEDGFR